jgi:hypothetical protein
MVGKPLSAPVCAGRGHSSDLGVNELLRGVYDAR